MKNNTKVRLHLSKRLFESLAKQVLAEDKNMSGGAYTETVKTPKQKAPKAGKLMEEPGEGVWSVWAKWKASFPEGTEFKQEHGYMVAKDTGGKELGKWNPSSKTGMHADDFQYNSLEEMETNVAEKNHGKEDLVQISLQEFHSGQDWSVKTGLWAIKHYPEIAKALGDTDPADLGNMIVSLAFAGTVGITTGLLVAKDKIQDAAQKIRNLVKSEKSGKEPVSEVGGDDSELAAIVGEIPDEMKAKIK